MTDRSLGVYRQLPERYADDMNGEIARWEHSQRVFDAHWGHQYQEVHHHSTQPTSPTFRPRIMHDADDTRDTQFRPIRNAKTRTSPVVTRTRVTRHGSHERPSSSGGDVLPIRQFVPPRRAESYSHPTPLEDFRKTRSWPPRGYHTNQALTPREAEDLICAGASTFKGYWDEIPNTTPGHDRFYAVMDSEHASRTDRASFQQNAYKDISLNLVGPADSAFPWISLEQPCMAYAFGKSPGTTTLNFRVSKSGSLSPITKIVGNLKPRKLKLLQILDRLQRLETGFDEEDPEELYRYLYSMLIEDPDKYKHPHFAMERQITDLIEVLANPNWLDYSSPKNHVVAKFFDSPDIHKKQTFFHQLLLAVELYLRIHSSEHTDKAKRKLLLQLPPKIAWDLAVAQRWMENMSITKERTSTHQSTFSFDLKSKNRQKEALRIFAETLKWPNMDEIAYVLEEKDRKERILEDRSADAMSWFSGVVLPGTTLPWLIMNTLIDCDRDTGEALKYLTHMYPSSGFQYRANTYWSSSCIVGKVLGAARGVTQIAGWVGPCIYTPDLKRTECVRIRQQAPPEPRLHRNDVEFMSVRSNPVGSEEDAYPIDDYEVPMPDMEEVTDLIRMEKLRFEVRKEQPQHRQGPGAPLVFDAAISFACGGDSWPLKLRYDVDFVQAFPCHQGPHVLFYDFAYTAMRIDEGLVDLADWAQQSGRRSRPSSARSSPSSKKSMALTSSSCELAHMQVKKVLAIEALGVSDNEVFARAWCANYGHSAVIANVKETCMACAIREAYAACISVVILTEGGKPQERDEGVNG